MFHELSVARIVEETREARSIVFDVPPSLARELEYRAGQFVTLELEVGGERLRRCYSLASCPDCEGEHKITVKRTAGGRVSNWLNDRLRVGDVLSVMPPEGRFVMDGREAPLLLFAGGSGITPVISILKSALTTTRRDVTLVYANRDRDAAIFAGELERLEQAYPGRLTVHHRLDAVHGVLDEAAVQAIASRQPGASCFLCGPGPFMALVERALGAAGVAPENVRVERFTIAPSGARPPADDRPAEPTSAQPEFIDVELRGERHRVPYVAGKTLLEVARDAGLDAPYSCEEGFCGCCASDLLEGRVTMTADDALSAEEKRRGMILACQSRPITARCAFRFVDS
jgi:3-ketosteroid 9alpha-monooxygenase subunit B